MGRAFILFLLLGAAMPAAAQDPNAVSQREIDQAIRKGAEFLKTAPSWGDWLHANCDELILLTMIHAGIPESNPKFDEYLRHCLQAPLEKTYKVALLAMSLEELDASKYQMKIAQCAAFLLDNQLANGQWTYGKPVDLKNYPFNEEEKKKVETGPKAVGAREFGATVREHKRPSKSIVVPQTKVLSDPPSGDNSNSQYAALGLRACHDAGVILPPEVLHLAEQWWRDGLGGDGWGYLSKNDSGYGSMTAGAVGALTIYLHIQGKPWLKDKEVSSGMEWLASNFTVTQNPKTAEAGQGGWQYYYLYALERAGIFFGTETFGAHEWYVEGAQYLLGQQKDDGSWMTKGSDHAIWDTCFAILFLRRATRPLRDVASEDRKSK